MNLIKIVLTGGPCAGKTTALNEIKTYLHQRNIPVITVPETATELILNGINPKLISVYKFQSLVLQKQLSKEKISEDYAKEYAKDSEICLIIYDRGLLDNKAYLENHEDFRNLLNTHDLSEIDILDEYDLVLDLLSTATCKPEAYNLLNEARMESIDTAVEVDRRTTNAWIHHRNLSIISSHLQLEEETKIIIDKIKNAIDGIKIKNVRSFLLDNTNSNISIYNESNSETINITKYFLDNDDSEYKHVLLKREYQNTSSYIYQVYKEVSGIITIIEDKKITKDKYFELLLTSTIQNSTNIKEINFLYNNLKYTICIYEDRQILRIETSTLDKNLIFPENLSIIEDITGKENYVVPRKNKVKVRKV